jgi:hypothetical protein
MQIPRFPTGLEHVSLPRGGSVARRRASLVVIAEKISLMLHLLLELLLVELEEHTEVEGVRLVCTVMREEKRSSVPPA